MAWAALKYLKFNSFGSTCCWHVSCSMFDDENEKLYLVMERGEIDLASFFRKNTLTHLMIRSYWHNMLLVVQTLHRHGQLRLSNFSNSRLCYEFMSCYSLTVCRRGQVV